MALYMRTAAFPLLAITAGKKAQITTSSPSTSIRVDLSKSCAQISSFRPLNKFPMPCLQVELLGAISGHGTLGSHLGMTV